jgi:hypothetical protein
MIPANEQLIGAQCRLGTDMTEMRFLVGAGAVAAGLETLALVHVWQGRLPGSEGAFNGLARNR